MVVLFIVGVIIYVFAFDAKSRAGYWSRFVGFFLIIFSVLSFYFGFSLASWFSLDWLSGK